MSESEKGTLTCAIFRLNGEPVIFLYSMHIAGSIILGMSFTVTGIKFNRRSGHLPSDIISNSKTLNIHSFIQSCSIGLTFYNNHLFREWDIPLATTTIHFMVIFVLAGFCRKGRQMITGKQSVVLSWVRTFFSH